MKKTQKMLNLMLCLYVLSCKESELYALKKYFNFQIRNLFPNVCKIIGLNFEGQFRL